MGRLLRSQRSPARPQPPPTGPACAAGPPYRYDRTNAFRASYCQANAELTEDVVTVWIVLIVVWLAFNAAVVFGGLLRGTRKQATMRPAGPWQTSPARDAEHH